MQIRSMGKNPSNYESVQKETNTYEQKLINIDDFNNIGKAKAKERVNKQKMKRCWKQQTFLNKKQKSEENKI